MNMDKTHQYLQIAAVVIGILTPCILLAGYVWHLGYTMTFGLDPNLINRDFSEVLAEAWYIGTLLLVFFLKKWWWLLVIFLALSTAFLIILSLLIFQKSKGRDWMDREITRDNQGKKILWLTLWHWKCVGELVSTVGIWCYIPLAVLVFTSFVIITPARIGRENAETQIAKIKNIGCKTAADQKDHIPCTSLFDFSAIPPTPLIQGILVSANANRVAVFDGRNLEVLPLTDRVKVIRPYLKP